MKILAGFERSCIVRDAFASKGCYAYSCDIEPARKPDSRLATHLHCDIYNVLFTHKWDLIILHPMCTALTVAGNSTYGRNPDGTPKFKHHERLAAIKYTEKLWHDAVSICSRACLENPVGVLTTNTDLPKPQYIQPYMFGHMEQKKTALFLHGLPDLVETNNVYDEMMKLPKNQRERLHYLPPGPHRTEERSRTFTGLANAMAEQWAI